MIGRVLRKYNLRKKVRVRVKVSFMVKRAGKTVTLII